MSWNPGTWRTLPAEQQPAWPDHADVAKVRSFLSALPALTSPQAVRALADRLRLVQSRGAFVLQAGDCAEPFGVAAVAGASDKHRIMASMAEVLASALRVPIVQVGRLAGQFAKPRSHRTDMVGGTPMPSFRGLIVNGPDAVEADRRPDPHRMISAYHTARLVLDELDRLALGRGAGAPAGSPDGRMWVSHEALLLDYEEPFVRRDPHTGRWYLLSTELPWIGERTRQVGGAHVDFLSQVANPIACKIGPNATGEEVLRLCETLDPGRVPGRLTFISRMGAGQVGDRLPVLVRTVQRARYPVIWLCDPMHGNQLSTSAGLKTRRMGDIVDELRGFLAVMRACDQWPGGVHLEIAGEHVTECLWDADSATEQQLGRDYRSLCDGRLSNAQATYVVEQFGRRARRGDDRGRPVARPGRRELTHAHAAD